MSSEQCPACTASTYETREAIQNPICAECGFVISPELDPPSIPSAEPGTADDAVPWSEFYTVTNETEKQVAQAHEHIEKLGIELHLSEDAISEASDLIIDAALENLADGRSWKLIATATLCVGARQAGEFRPTGRVANSANLRQTKVHQSIRLLQRHFQIEPVQYTADGLVPFLCDDLDLSTEVRDRSRRIIDSCGNAFSCRGVNPVSVAGAAVYITAEGEVTQREVANSLSITPETVRVRVLDIEEVTGEMLRND